MIGLDDVEAAPMLGPDGEPITARGWFNSESIAIDGSYVYIGLERVNQVLRFDFSKGFTRSRGEVVPMPPAVKQAAVQQGAGSAGVRAEGHAAGGHADRDLRARPRSEGQFDRLSGRRSLARTIQRPPHQKFDISDAVLLPSGDLLVLERKFSLVSGVGIRIRRIALASVAPGEVVDGPAIFNADLGDEIDNMEGIDALVTPEGDTVLTMISDDNFSMIQRTLLLQFTLVE